MKNTYKVTFYAELSEDDLNAMKSVFYDSMNESMQIEPWGLKVERDSGVDPEDAVHLEEDDLLRYDEMTGNIRVDKQVFDDFVPDSYVDIVFVEDNDNKVYQYKMIKETDNYIEMEYLG